MHRYWTFKIILTACVLALASRATASPDVWATGTAWRSDDPGFEGYWKYCYEVHWTGLPHGVSHIEIFLCRPIESECGCYPDFFAFADTVGQGYQDCGEGCPTVHYYAGFEVSGDPSTGLDGLLVKFEPYEGLPEASAEGSASLCFYSIAAPFYGTHLDQVSVKFADGFALGPLDGPLPVCSQGYSPAGVSTWGCVKAKYR